MQFPSIDIEFEKTSRLAVQMDQAAERLQKLAEEKMLTCIRGTKAAWNGEAAEHFTGREVRLCAQIAARAVELKQAAQIVQKQAKAMYLAEKCNETIAEHRTY